MGGQFDEAFERTVPARFHDILFRCRDELDVDGSLLSSTELRHMV